MSASRHVAQMSANRLGGEPVPGDVRILQAHNDELARRTGIALHREKRWAPWLDTSYLSAAERANPDIAANVRAIEEVCGLIAFIAEYEEGEYIGYWRGPGKRAVAVSPLVRLDNEGQFNLCAGPSFAEAVLGEVYGDEKFAELRDWLRSLGIGVRAETAAELKYPRVKDRPDELHNKLYRRYLKEAGRA
jgi:hypothetical protein